MSTNQISSITTNQETICVEANFNRYIFESKDNDYFIASISLKPYSMNNLIAKIKENSNYVEEFLPKKYDISLIGNSTHFRNIVSDRHSEYVFEVKIEENKKYNRYDLKLVHFFEKIPTSEKAMIRFLAKKIKSIGEATAKKIVNHFGVENVEKIFNCEIHRLTEIKGIKESQIEEINKTWIENRVIFELMNYLKAYEISDSVCLKIYNEHQTKSLDLVRKNPYALSQIEGITFKTADKIALANGFKLDNKTRILYGISYSLTQLMYSTSNSVIEEQELIQYASDLLNITKSSIQSYVNLLKEKNKIVVVEQKQIDEKNNHNTVLITSERIQKLEQSIFDLLMTISKTEHNRQLLSTQEIADFLNKNEFNLDESQLKVGEYAFNNNIIIMSGGPGTGKSTTAKAIVTALERAGNTVALIAPTGKAANKLTQSTGRPAETIHRFLKILPDNTESFANKNSLLDKDEYLDYDYILVDKSSMLELYVLFQLLRRINPVRTSIMFIGDPDQLPAIGIGAFFRDLIDSQLFPVVHLTKLHRISDKGSVAKNALNIKNKLPLDLELSEDFEFIPASTEERTVKKIKEIYDDLIKQGNSSLDIQILSPTREKKLGCRELNKMVRPIANINYVTPDGKEKPYDYTIGDKLMHIENNYDLMVFNGDTGVVVEQNYQDNSMVVEMGDPNYSTERIVYDRDLYKQLELAYCITVHKSQGSDYPYVIIPLTKKHYYQWNQALLYTALTRTKKKVFLVGSKDVLNTVYKPEKNKRRKTNLEYIFAKERAERGVYNNYNVIDTQDEHF